MGTQRRKAYVSVNLDVDKEGVYHPRFIRWDNGLIFQIDQILYKCRASSKKVGGGGIRNTVMIKGKESFGTGFWLTVITVWRLSGSIPKSNIPYLKKTFRTGLLRWLISTKISLAGATLPRSFAGI